MKKFKVITLGCRTNQYESQAYTDQLRLLGCVSSNEESVEVCIVNTCTVTESADSSSRHQIRALLRENPNAQVFVTGCLAENNPDAIAAIDPRITVVPNSKKESLMEYVFPEEDNLPEFQINQFDDHTRAFVKVQDGCNSFCTYCIIPYVRGRSRSRPIADVVKEVEQLVHNGYKEVVLTGINIGDFDGGGSLSDLVRAVDKIQGLQRLRISSIDPDEVDDSLAAAVLEGKNTCPSMHIVLQAGSNVILKKMNRKYTKQIFLETVEKMQKRRPDFTVTTDIIVGFPGETEADFAETVDLVEKIQFAKVHMFPFSPRKRTRAATYPNQVPQDVIRSRKQELLRVAEKSAFALREKFVGHRDEVLLENDVKEDFIAGHTRNFLKVWIPKQNYRPNDVIMVKMEENTPEGLVGHV